MSKIILASASPRRQELLKEIVPDFEIVVANVDEESLVDADPVITARQTARAKAAAVFSLHTDAVVIGGDTVVAVDGMQLAKPIDEADAFRMLRLLSGRTHTVVTGVCILGPGAEQAFEVSTQVTFRPLSDEEIGDYILTGEPMDKAGAYGAQGRAANLIERVDGSLTNVIGLPVDEVRSALEGILNHEP